jgi:hypothetical protein
MSKSRVQLPSGRFVVYRLLSTTEIEQNEAVAAAESKETTSAVEYNAKVEGFGVKMMVLEYSPVAKKGEIPAPDRWTKAGNELQLQWSSIFNAKDTAILKGIYRSKHVALKSELDEILAGEQQLLED